MTQERLDTTFEGLHVCPVCRKLYLREKELYLHILKAHQDGQYMAYTFRADLYQRWQNRIPKCKQ